MIPMKNLYMPQMSNITYAIQNTLAFAKDFYQNLSSAD